MPPRPKTAAEKAKLRAKIIDTARDVFIHKGVEAVTMRDIAKRVGYSATAIYLYFADKQALIQAVCDTDLLKLASEFKKVLVIQDPVERLFALGRAYAMFALNYPNHYRMIFMTPHAPLDPAASNIEQNNVEQDAYFQLKSVVLACMVFVHWILFWAKSKPYNGARLKQGCKPCKQSSQLVC